MISGKIEAGYPVVDITLFIPNRPPVTIEFVIDTGFAGFLTLPLAAIEVLQLPHFYSTPANLADDSDIFVSVYTAFIDWQGELRETEIMAIGRRPLIGKSLLRDNEVCITFEEGGPITVRQVNRSNG